MTTIICEMDSMELCVWKEKHLQRACSGDERTGRYPGEF